MSSIDYLRFRLAIHEGAHCVAAHHHGYRIGAASIMLDRGGCVWYSAAPTAPDYQPTFTGSVLHIPDAERRWLEGKACVTLAGPMATAIYAPEMQSGYTGPPEVTIEDLERLAADRLRLPAETREIVERPLDDAPSDEAIAWRLAGLSASSWQTRDEYLRWIYAEVRVWVMSEPFPETRGYG